MDMRAGADRLLAHVVEFFGGAQAHHGFLFANARASRVKLAVHDAFGVWCAARRLNAGSFVWPRGLNDEAAPLQLSRQQFDALVVGCSGRHARGVLLEFLEGWNGTLVCDGYKGCEAVFRL